jgi:hypothetical protein
MSIIYNIMLMYALAFIIGLFVACIIWLLYSSMTAKSIKTTNRESYSEMKQLKHKK